MNSYRLKYNCDTYKDIFNYAVNTEWQGNKNRPMSKCEWKKFPKHLRDNDPVLTKIDGFCSGMWLMRMEPRSLFREHMDVTRQCGVNICLHELESITFILEPDVHMDAKNPLMTYWNAVEPVIENQCASYEEIEYEPSGIYLFNASRRHGVINYSYEPRYSGFFTISKDIRYEDAKELLGELVL
jgi:hypothetical protein